ncbi:uncharacterized protein LOC126728487 [Quercus robur]|uniref:uncharacterized protein LOC126728487 n=1 Tax=Quercus robur TaxID=38942 RepID=UPI002161B850|nr:uncharacterized protein LOC126728487 [Quercus robur]
MAVDLFSSELLLPSQLLSDEEDILLVPESLKPFNLRKDSSCCYNKPWEPPSHATTESAFSSPGESELGSAETDSDKDDDYIAELTRQMAQYMLRDDDKNKHKNSHQSFENFEKTWGLTSSPESTFWSPLGSNQGSSDGTSQEPSPPPTPEFEKDPFWDSSYDVVGKLEKMYLDDYEKPKKHQHVQGVRSTPLKPNVGFSSNQAQTQPLTDYQIRAIELYRLQQERIMKQQAKASEQKDQPQQFEKKARFRNGFGNGGRGQAQAQAQTNPWSSQAQNHHQQVGSGMGAFCKGGSDSRKVPSCGSGTGVFLPRGIWYSSETRKKPGCPAVFIPARVVQALQVHFDHMGARSRGSAAGFSRQHEAVSGRNGLNIKQKRQSRAVPAMGHHEMCLPQEWTY